MTARLKEIIENLKLFEPDDSFSGRRELIAALEEIEQRLGMLEERAWLEGRKERAQRRGN